MPEWTLTHTIGGIDRSSSVFGRTDIKRERNAAAIARFGLRPPAGALDATVYVGQTVTIDANWDTDPANRRFTGIVESARWDAAQGLLRIVCTDGLREAMRARTTVQVLALMPGARWREEVFGPEVDGWEQFGEAVQTLDYSYYLDRNGTDQWVSRAAKGTPDHTFAHASGEILEDSVAVSPYERRNLVNRITIEAQARGVILHHWELDCSWSAYPSGMNFCDDYRQTPWWLPWQNRVSGAAQKAGWRIKQPQALVTTGTTGGFDFTGLPDSNPNPCGQGAPWVIDPEDPRVVHAGWTAVYRWEQTCRRHYTITVEAPDAIVVHGALIRQEKVGYDEGDQQRGWSSGTGAQTPSGGNWTNPAGGHHQSIELDQDAVDVVVECAAALEAARIRHVYRGTQCTMEPLSAKDAFAVDIADTVRVDGAVVHGLTTTATGTVEAIDESWDSETADAGIALTLGISRCPGAGGNDDALTAPSAPSLDPGYSLDTGLSLNTYIGGRAGAPVFDPSWRGWITNLESPLGGAEFYTTRQFAVEYPKRPTAAKETFTATISSTYRVYPPHEELVQTVI